MDQEKIKKWMEENLVTKKEAAAITDQSLNAFNQSVKMRLIEPFFEKGDNTSSKVRLYLKSDILDYAKNKRRRTAK